MIGLPFVEVRLARPWKMVAPPWSDWEAIQSNSHANLGGSDGYCPLAGAKTIKTAKRLDAANRRLEALTHQLSQVRESAAEAHEPPTTVNGAVVAREALC